MRLALTLERIATPIGTMHVLTDDENRVRALDWEDYEDRLKRLLRLHYGTNFTVGEARHPSPARPVLDAYFAGELTAIETLTVDTAGTPFQRAVWAALRKIPAGNTVSYGTLAAAIGRPKAVRAVGAANGANPIGIVVPCHRVIGANAALTGYGGGLHRKQWLLRHEGVPISEVSADL